MATTLPPQSDEGSDKSESDGDSPPADNAGKGNDDAEESGDDDTKAEESDDKDSAAKESNEQCTLEKKPSSKKAIKKEPVLDSIRVRAIPIDIYRRGPTLEY
ncbi:hypothetical protein HAX54_037493 [Datura stramonium]|uniref:Uncharacterized protein n=1 Tax=Datura stramonium TaxID=4076 RepID=A0ABS8VKQ7_DATST|nr:hypothetical protein [Datura stramonium]